MNPSGLSTLPGTGVLPLWPVESGLAWLLLAILFWRFSAWSHSRGHAAAAAFFWPSSLLFALLGIGAFLPRSVQAWGLLAVVVGAGWSCRFYFADGIAGLLILAEGRVVPGASVSGEGFSGKVASRGWRCVVLADARGRLLHVPNRSFHSHALRVQPPGRVSEAIRLRIPQGLDPAAARRLAVGWLARSPWVSSGPPEAEPDPSAPGVLLIRASLLRSEDRSAVVRGLLKVLEAHSSDTGPPV